MAQVRPTFRPAQTGLGETGTQPIAWYCGVGSAFQLPHPQARDHEVWYGVIRCRPQVSLRCHGTLHEAAINKGRHMGKVSATRAFACSQWPWDRPTRSDTAAGFIPSTQPTISSAAFSPTMTQAA